MEPLSCYFCDRVNPGDAIYCNACGTPLAMKPCRKCDAVNAREAEHCFRCDTALPVASAVTAAAPVADVAATGNGVAAADAASGPDSESVVERAGETIEALRRALHASRNASAESAASPMQLPEAAVESDDTEAGIENRAGGVEVGTGEAEQPVAAIDESLESVDVRAAPPEADEHPPYLDPTATSDGAFDSIVRDLPDEPPLEPAQWQVDDARLHHVDADVPREPPTYRPSRPRAVALIALFVIAMAIPAALYVERNPRLLAEWFPTGTSSQAPVTTSAAPAPAPEQAPDASSASSATPAQDNASSPTTVAADANEAASEPTATPPPANEPTASVPVIPPLKPPPAARDSDEKAEPDRTAPTTASRSAATRSRAQPPREERATPSRSVRPAPAAERDTSPAPIRGEACTAAVAALGLCTPEPRR